MNGVLVIDKPGGITSHDVVARVRRVLSERRVGHAGTLDPMATGVLVVMVGEATKLAPWLTREDKRYRATVKLGVGTATLDAEGAVTARAPLPDWWSAAEADARVAAALAAERARTEQQPPVFSAIKVAGRTAHARTRAGEEVALAVRSVAVRAIDVVARGADTLELDLAVSKGYYVRALARDLGDALGVPAHLMALRRTASGVFELRHALELARLEPLTPLISMAEAARLAMPHAELTAVGAERARHGKLLGDDDFVSRPPPEASAWLGPDGELVAVGQRRGEGWAVARGFRGPGLA